MPPKRISYVGRIKYGTPYFDPIGFEPKIFRLRRLKVSPDTGKYTNLPMVRRNKHWVFKLFGVPWFLSVGYPFAVRRIELGWKDKFDTPRHEWSPMLLINFFLWQICIMYISPYEDECGYWEQYLWYSRYYSCYGSDHPDIEKAEKGWPWMSGGKSSWNKNFVL